MQRCRIERAAADAQIAPRLVQLGVMGLLAGGDLELSLGVGPFPKLAERQCQIMVILRNIRGERHSLTECNGSRLNLASVAEAVSQRRLGIGRCGRSATARSAAWTASVISPRDSANWLCRTKSSGTSGVHCAKSRDPRPLFVSSARGDSRLSTQNKSAASAATPAHLAACNRAGNRVSSLSFGFDAEVLLRAALAHLPDESVVVEMQRRRREQERQQNGLRRSRRRSRR